MNYKVDTYRDGGTVSIDSDDATYCINKMMNTEDVGAVYSCYPTEGVPISGLPELKRANRILNEAIPFARTRNEAVAIGRGLTWILTEMNELNEDGVVTIDRNDPCTCEGADDNVGLRVNYDIIWGDADVIHDPAKGGCGKWMRNWDRG